MRILVSFLLLLFVSLSSVWGQKEAKIQLKLVDLKALEQVEQIDTSLTLQRIFPFSAKHEKRHEAMGLHLWYKVVVSDSVYAKRLLGTYQQLSGVELASLESFSVQQPESHFIEVKPDKLRSGGQSVVNDPLYPKQWNLQNRLYPQGIDINIEKAWLQEQGSRDVVVAVMDGPIDIQHEDLRPNMWTNTIELHGKPGVDDDENGFVDDIYGYSYVPAERYRSDNHGTHVAGVIAAVNNNGIGVSSVAGGNGQTNGVKIMRCHIIGIKGMPFPSHEQVAKSFVYAADNGAVISQNSWAGHGSDLIADGVNYFMENAGQYEGSPMKGGLVIWAAGNDGSSNPGEPETHPKIKKDNLIIVSSLAPDGTKASYSNYGDWVHVAAPGGEYNYQGVISTIANNRYGYDMGTSMACPHVSGIAALIVSKYKGKDLTPTAVKHRILTSVRDVDRYTEGQKCWRLTGRGLVDAEKALLENKGMAPNRVKNLWIRTATHKFIDLAWIMPTDPDDISVDSSFVYYSDQPFSDATEAVKRKALSTAAYAPGDTAFYRCELPVSGADYYFRVNGKDRWGNSSNLSEAVSGKTSLNKPLIYGDYLYNRFTVFQHDDSYLPLGQQDTLSLRFFVMAPQGMTVDCHLEDPGKSLKMDSFTQNEIKLSLIAGSRAPGVYKANLIVSSVKNVHDADTLCLSYQVQAALQYPIPRPAIRDDLPRVFETNKIKGEFDIDLMPYVISPNEFYFDYDTSQNVKVGDFDHGLFARLQGDKLHVAYEFNPEMLVGEEMFDCIKFNVDVVDNYKVSNVIKFRINILEPNPIEEIEDGKVNVYYSSMDQSLVVKVNQPVNCIRLYTAKGYLVAEYSHPNDRLNIAHLPSGIYVVQVLTPSGSFTKKIVK